MPLIAIPRREPSASAIPRAIRSPNNRPQHSASVAGDALTRVASTINGSPLSRCALTNAAARPADAAEQKRQHDAGDPEAGRLARGEFAAERAILGDVLADTEPATANS
jgi:hypothetical protein